jgi:hypothetical protein
MLEKIRKLPVWLFGLVVAGALAFGAQRAFATPVSFTCNNPPYNGGTCTDQSACASNCDAIFGVGNWTQARCQGGCCECVL